MASGSRSIGLAKVLTGWTGSLTVTVGATAVPIVPSEPTSAVELALRVDVVLGALGASPYGASVSAAGVITWRAVSSFTLAATGVIRSRLNVAASTTGTTVTGSGAHADGFYPARGMLVESPMVASSTTMSVSDGAGAINPLPMTSTVSLEVHDTLANIWAHEASFNTDHMWDLWAGGVYRGRLRVEDANRSRIGISAEHAALRLSCVSVFERGPS